MQRRIFRGGRRGPTLAAGLFALAALAGCAAHPNDVLPEYVSAAPYNNASCAELGREYGRLNRAIAEADTLQRTIRLTDIYGYIPIVPVAHFPMPLGRMMGKDREESIALMKGNQAAVIRMAAAKRCPGSLPATSATSDSPYILK